MSAGPFLALLSIKAFLGQPTGVVRPTGAVVSGPVPIRLVHNEKLAIAGLSRVFSDLLRLQKSNAAGRFSGSDPTLRSFGNYVNEVLARRFRWCKVAITDH